MNNISIFSTVNEVTPEIIFYLTNNKTSLSLLPPTATLHPTVLTLESDHVEHINEPSKESEDEASSCSIIHLKCPSIASAVGWYSMLDQNISKKGMADCVMDYVLEAARYRVCHSQSVHIPEIADSSVLTELSNGWHFNFRDDEGDLKVGIYLTLFSCIPLHHPKMSSLPSLNITHLTISDTEKGLDAPFDAMDSLIINVDGEEVSVESLEDGMNLLTLLKVCQLAHVGSPEDWDHLKEWREDIQHKANVSHAFDFMGEKIPEEKELIPKTDNIPDSPSSVSSEDADLVRRAALALLEESGRSVASLLVTPTSYVDQEAVSFSSLMEEMREVNDLWEDLNHIYQTSYQLSSSSEELVQLDPKVWDSLQDVALLGRYFELCPSHLLPTMVFHLTSLFTFFDPPTMLATSLPLISNPKRREDVISLVFIRSEVTSWMSSIVPSLKYPIIKRLPSSEDVARFVSELLELVCEDLMSVSPTSPSHPGLRLTTFVLLSLYKIDPYHASEAMYNHLLGPAVAYALYPNLLFDLFGPFPNLSEFGSKLSTTLLNTSTAHIYKFVMHCLRFSLNLPIHSSPDGTPRNIHLSLQTFMSKGMLAVSELFLHLHSLSVEDRSRPPEGVWWALNSKKHVPPAPFLPSSTNDRLCALEVPIVPSSNQSVGEINEGGENDDELIYILAINGDCLDGLQMESILHSNKLNELLFLLSNPTPSSSSDEKVITRIKIHQVSTIPVFHQVRLAFSHGKNLLNGRIAIASLLSEWRQDSVHGLSLQDSQYFSRELDQLFCEESYVMGEVFLPPSLNQDDDYEDPVRFLTPTISRVDSEASSPISPSPQTPKSAIRRRFSHSPVTGTPTSSRRISFVSSRPPSHSIQDGGAKGGRRMSTFSIRSSFGYASMAATSSLSEIPSSKLATLLQTIFSPYLYDPTSQPPVKPPLLHPIIPEGEHSHKRKSSKKLK